VQLIFDRSIIRTTPGPFRTRVITLPISAYAPSGSVPELTAVFSAPDSEPYCLSFLPPTPGFAIVSIDSIRRSHRGLNIQN
jgi:hypothetical protein